MNFSKNYRKKIFSKELIVSIVVAIIVFILDRVSKIIVIKHQAESKTSFFVNDYLNLDLVWNTGIGSCYNFFNFSSYSFFNQPN